MKGKIRFAAVALMVCAANAYAQSGPFVKHLMRYEYFSQGIDKYILSVGLDREMKYDGQCLIYDRKDTSLLGRMDFQHGQLVDKLSINTPDLKFSAFFVYPSDTNYKLIKIEELNKLAVPHGEFIKEKFYEGKRVAYQKYNYVFGKKNGICEEYVLHSWDKPGKGTIKRYSMSSDVLDGMYLEMWDSGDTLDFGLYEKGKKEGRWYSYRDFGFGGRKDSSWYKAGKLNGTSKMWNAKGQLISEKNYLNGKLDGRSRAWHDNGTLAMERQFKNGLIQGTVKYWSDKGVLIRITRYNDDGIQEGLSEAWNENGTLIEREHYHEDELDGKCEYFFDDGKPKCLANYSKGKLNGVVKDWNEQGELIRHQIFNNGELVKTYINKLPESEADVDNFGDISEDNYSSPYFYRSYVNIEADKDLIYFGQKSEAVVDLLNIWYNSLKSAKKKQCRQIREIEIIFRVEPTSINLIEIKGAGLTLNQEIKDFILSRYTNNGFRNFPASVKVIVPFDHSYKKYEQ